MIRLILLWSLAGDQTARDLCERIGGVVASIEMDTRIYGDHQDAWDLLTLEMLGAGIIDDAETSRRNLERWEP
jgi:hypothetical protein